MRLGAFFGFRDARLRHREPEMMVVVRGRGGGVVVGRGAGVAGRASAGEHRARRYDEVEEAQRRLRQREAQLRAPKAERSSEEAGEHLFGIYVVRAPINACRASAGEVVALWLCRCWQFVGQCSPAGASAAMLRSAALIVEARNRVGASSVPKKPGPKS